MISVRILRVQEKMKYWKPFPEEKRPFIKSEVNILTDYGKLVYSEEVFSFAPTKSHKEADFYTESFPKLTPNIVAETERIRSSGSAFIFVKSKSIFSNISVFGQ